MKAIAGFLIVLGLSLPAGPAAAEFYRWTDESGITHFASVPPPGRDAKPISPKPLNGYSAPPPASGTTSGPPSIVMYSAAWCGVCKRARRYLRDRRIPFKEYDVETTYKGRRDYERLNGTGVPILLVGDKRLNGFSTSSFEAAYDNP